jgi:hypothetical protein
MKELDQLVENFFQPKRDTLGLDQLVEMVEELMGERKKISPEERQEIETALNAREKLVGSIIKSLDPPAEIHSKKPSHINVTNTGGREARTEILKSLENDFEAAAKKAGFEIEKLIGVRQNKERSAIRYLIIKHPLLKDYSIRLAQGDVKGAKPNSTKFEGNLANALNGNTDFEGSGERWNDLANKIVNSIGIDKFDDKKFEKLGREGIGLTTLYKREGATQSEPKTDLISTDGEMRISVKKAGGQFVSAQGPEATAIFKSIIKEELQSSKAAGKLASLIKRLFTYEAGLSKIKDLPPEDANKIRNKRKFLLSRILNFAASDRREAIIRESLLGEKKFTTEKAIPNYFLVWDEEGSGKLYTAKQFIKKVASQTDVKVLDVRGRGGERGLALRGQT